MFKTIKMFKKMAAVFGVFFVFMLITDGVFAYDGTRTSRVITVSKDKEITRDFYINAGEKIEISGKVTGDVILMGGEVLVDGLIDGDLLVFGGKVNLEGKVTNDIRIVGGEVNINGEVGKNVTVVGGDITITEDANISAGVLVVGGDVELDSVISGDLSAAAGKMTISNQILGNTEMYVGNLTVSDNASIAGEFIYTSDQDAVISKDASVSGKIVRRNPPEMAMQSREVMSKKISSLGVFMKAFHALSLLILGALILRFLPNYSVSVTEKIQFSPLKSLGVGVLFMFSAPLLIVILLMTLVGIPLAFILILFVIFISHFGMLFVFYWLGSKVFSHKKYLSLAVGVLFYFLLSLVVGFGTLVKLLALIIGFGAQVLASFEFYKKAIKARVI